MTTNSDDARREAFAVADRTMVRPKVEFNALLKHAGATKDILSMREVMYYLGQYIMKKQLYDQTQQHIVHCSTDALGQVLGLDTFSVKEPGPLFTMITKNLVPVRIQESSNAPQQHSHSQPDKIQEPSNAPQQRYFSQPDRPPDRPPEVNIQESCLAAQQHSHSQPARPPDGPPDRPSEASDSDADSTSTIPSRRRRRTSEPGPSHGDGDEEDDNSEDSERKRRRADSYSLTFDNSLSWYVIADLRNEQGRVRHSSQSSEAPSYAASNSNRSDHFSVEFEVESIDSDDGDSDFDDDTSLSDDDQVYEVTIYEDDDTDEDTEITEADYWRCLKCNELNPPLPRNCNRCWSLRQDWLRDIYPRAIQNPLRPISSPGPDKSASEEQPGVEEEEIDVPDGRRTTPVPPGDSPSSCLLSSQELSQASVPPTYSQASTISLPSSQNPSTVPLSSSSLTSPPPPAACAPSSSVVPRPVAVAAADPGSDLCVICQSEPKNGCIVHGKTGHLMACFRCARKLKRRNKLCPVCREPIQAVVKTFFC